MKRQEIHFSWKDALIDRQFRSAASLHSHTSHSRESLGIVATYAKRSALVDYVLAKVAKRYSHAVGDRLDFARSYFTPPLSASGAYLVEADQIRNELDLQPMVSLTDHDTIAAPRLLRLFLDHDTVPVSLEWTVPFGRSYFHLGIHNLPEDEALEIMENLGGNLCTRCRIAGSSCTASHGSDCLIDPCELLEGVASIPDVLVVLNHPLWDVSGLGSMNQRRQAGNFLEKCGRYVHAIEVNGLRNWRENLDSMELAEQWSIPVISGGDRHGCEPNAVLNLTGAETFSEFVDEVRTDGRSVVLFMPQYRQPLEWRKLRTVWDVLREQQTQPGIACRWPERIFIPWRDGRVLPLSAPEWSETSAGVSIECPQTAERFAGDLEVGTKN